MALGHVAERGGQQCEAIFQPRGDLFGGHDAQPGRRQLQPQRHALHAAADALHRLRVLAERKVRVLLACTLGEELHGTVAVNRRVCLVLWEGEALKRQHPLLTDIQPLARGHQELSLMDHIESDITIVGAGFSGLWTAYYIKHLNPDARVVMVEAEVAGAGEGELERARDG